MSGMNASTIPTEDHFGSRWGELLTLEMQRKGISDLGLAQAASIELGLETPMSEMAISNYRRGVRTQISPRIMCALARVLGVPARVLFPLDLEEGQ